MFYILLYTFCILYLITDFAYYACYLQTRAGGELPRLETQGGLEQASSVIGPLGRLLFRLRSAPQVTNPRRHLDVQPWRSTELRRGGAGQGCQWAEHGSAGRGGAGQGGAGRLQAEPGTMPAAKAPCQQPSHYTGSEARERRPRGVGYWWVLFGGLAP